MGTDHAEGPLTPPDLLPHLVQLAALDKHFAWWAAKNYAALLPWCCADLPERLTRHMRAAANEAQAAQRQAA